MHPAASFPFDRVNVFLYLFDNFNGPADISQRYSVLRERPMPDADLIFTFVALWLTWCNKQILLDPFFIVSSDSDSYVWQ